MIHSAGTAAIVNCPLAVFLSECKTQPEAPR